MNEILINGFGYFNSGYDYLCVCDMELLVNGISFQAAICYPQSIERMFVKRNNVR